MTTAVDLDPTHWATYTHTHAEWLTRQPRPTNGNPLAKAAAWDVWHDEGAALGLSLTASLAGYRMWLVKSNPNWADQTRIGAGSAGGGRWTAGGGHQTGTTSDSEGTKDEREPLPEPEIIDAPDAGKKGGGKGKKKKPKTDPYAESRALLEKRLAEIQARINRIKSYPYSRRIDEEVGRQVVKLQRLYAKVEARLAQLNDRAKKRAAASKKSMSVGDLLVKVVGGGPLLTKDVDHTPDWYTHGWVPTAFGAAQMAMRGGAGSGGGGPVKRTPKKATSGGESAAATIDRLRLTVDGGTLEGRGDAHDLLAGRSKVELVEIARELSIPNASRRTVPDLRHEIVETTVGRRLDSISIRGFTGSRPGESESMSVDDVRAAARAKPTPPVKAAVPKSPRAPRKSAGLPEAEQGILERIRVSGGSIRVDGLSRDDEQSLVSLVQSDRAHVDQFGIARAGQTPKPKAAERHRGILERAQAQGMVQFHLVDTESATTYNDDVHTLMQRGMLEPHSAGYGFVLTDKGRAALSPPTKAPKKAAPAKSPVDIDGAVAVLGSATSRQAAHEALAGLSKRQLVEVGQRVMPGGIRSGLSKDELTDALVEATVGSRLDFQAIQGGAVLRAADSPGRSLRSGKGDAAAQAATSTRVPKAVDIAGVAVRVNAQPSEAAIIRLLSGEGHTAAKLKKIAEELGVYVPPNVKAKTALQTHIAERVARERGLPSGFDVAAAQAATGYRTPDLNEMSETSLRDLAAQHNIRWDSTRPAADNIAALRAAGVTLDNSGIRVRTISPAKKAAVPKAPRAPQKAVGKLRAVDARVERLVRAERAGERIDVTPFYGTAGERGVFSQHWRQPFSVDGVTYPTAEHWMMASKARLFGDDEALRRILAADSPVEAKRIGREVRNFDPAVWEAAAYDIVVRGNFAKFSQHPDLRDKLLRTGDNVLVEASPRDVVWGIGRGGSDPDKLRPSQWRGRNRLGFALMDVRERLSGTAAPETGLASGGRPVSGREVDRMVPVSRNSEIIVADPAARRAFDAMGGIAFEQINNMLRGDARPSGATRRRMEGHVAVVDSVMQTSPISSDVEVWRGLATGRGIFGQRLSDDLTGFEWDEPGYMSTSWRRETAELFAITDPKSPGVLIRMVAPEGTQAVRLLGGEGELLMQRGLRLRVVKDRGVSTITPRNSLSGWVGEPRQVRMIDVEVVPSANHQLRRATTMLSGYVPPAGPDAVTRAVAPDLTKGLFRRIARIITGGGGKDHWKTQPRVRTGEHGGEWTADLGDDPDAPDILPPPKVRTKPPTVRDLAEDLGVDLPPKVKTPRKARQHLEQVIAAGKVDPAMPAVPKARKVRGRPRTPVDILDRVFEDMYPDAKRGRTLPDAHMAIFRQARADLDAKKADLYQVAERFTTHAAKLRTAADRDTQVAGRVYRSMAHQLNYSHHTPPDAPYELVDWAERHGWHARTIRGVAEEGGGGRYISVEVANPATRERFTATWHTARPGRTAPEHYTPLDRIQAGDPLHGSASNVRQLRSPAELRTHIAARPVATAPKGKGKIQRATSGVALPEPQSAFMQALGKLGGTADGGDRQFPATVRDQLRKLGFVRVARVKVGGKATNRIELTDQGRAWLESQRPAKVRPDYYPRVPRRQDTGLLTPGVTGGTRTMGSQSIWTGHPPGGKNATVHLTKKARDLHPESLDWWHGWIPRLTAGATGFLSRLAGRGGHAASDDPDFKSPAFRKALKEHGLIRVVAGSGARTGKRTSHIEITDDGRKWLEADKARRAAEAATPKPVKPAKRTTPATAKKAVPRASTSGYVVAVALRSGGDPVWEMSSYGRDKPNAASTAQLRQPGRRVRVFTDEQWDAIPHGQRSDDWMHTFGRSSLREPRIVKPVAPPVTVPRKRAPAKKAVSTTSATSEAVPDLSGEPTTEPLGHRVFGNATSHVVRLGGHEIGAASVGDETGETYINPPTNSDWRLAEGEYGPHPDLDTAARVLAGAFRRQHAMSPTDKATAHVKRLLDHMLERLGEDEGANGPRSWAGHLHWSVEQAMARQAELAPYTVLDLQGVQYRRLGSGELARYNHFGNELLLSQGWIDRSAGGGMRLMQASQASHQSGWSTPTPDPQMPGGSIAHEFGHHVVKTISFGEWSPAQARAFLPQLEEALGLPAGAIYSGRRFDKQAINRRLAEHSAAIRKAISGYAAQASEDMGLEGTSSQFDEMLAEVWQEFSMMGKKARPHIKTLGQILVRLAEDSAERARR